jgi:transcriptional regulator with XRE-family HTH domain
MENALAAYLKDRRAKLDPRALGFSLNRRRTAGLRREEVAQRANISPVWYTCLEQGRGGAPSAEVLDRIARALMLTDAEREHLFLLALGRPPEVKFRASDGVTPRLQRVLDKLDPTPAVIRTAIWNVVAWNRAATVLLGDFRDVPPDQRNALRVIFLEPHVRAGQEDWEAAARYIVGSFRADISRAGAAADAEPLIEELCERSPDFKRIWRDNDVQGDYGEAVKRMRHPELGSISFEYSIFAVDGRPDLQMVIYNPASEDVAQRISTAVLRLRR